MGLGEALWLGLKSFELRRESLPPHQKPGTRFTTAPTAREKAKALTAI